MKKKREYSREPSTMISMRIKQSDADILNQLAAKFGTSRSEVIKTALKCNLKKYLGNVRYIDPKQGEEIRKAAYDMLHILVDTLHQIKCVRVGINYTAAHNNDMDNVCAAYNTDLINTMNKLEHVLTTAGKITFRLCESDIGKGA